MERNFKRLLLRKTDVLKTLIFSERNLKKCTNFEDQKVQGIFAGNVYIGIIVFSFLSSIKSCLRFPLNCFLREIKWLYQSSFGNEVDFMDIMNVSLNILAKD